MKFHSFIILLLITLSCQGQKDFKNTSVKISDEELLRIGYISQLDSTERDFFVYLPKGYKSDTSKRWPTLMHLHGNGSRGNGKEDLIWVTKHGPLMEAWVQKRDLPFVIIVPQLQMLGMDTINRSIAQRDTLTIPKRLKNGVPARIPKNPSKSRSENLNANQELPFGKRGKLNGWYMVEDDLISILDHVQINFNIDPNRSFITGLSYGGYGTWYIASKYPSRFSAIAPVAGWGHPDLMNSLTNSQMPIWCFAGADDQIVKREYFYPGINRLKELGHNNYKFNIEEDYGHDVWKKVYSESELYDWFLSF